MNLTNFRNFKSHIRSAVAAAGCLLTLAALQSCSGNEDYDLWADVRGTVTDYRDGSPIENASVVLTPSAITVMTNSAGQFEIKSIDEGQYTITVQKSGYVPNRKNFKAISGEETQVNIQLSPIPTE